VRGTHLVAGQAQAYTTTTATFTVTPATLAVSATREGAALRVVVGHATEEPGLEDEALTGRLWLVDHRVPTGRLAPLRVGDLAAAGVVLTPDGGAAVTADAVTEALDGEVPTTVATVATAPTAALTVVVTDALGNTGTATVPAAD
jgi:hypothetical protein